MYRIFDSKDVIIESYNIGIVRIVEPDSEFSASPWIISKMLWGNEMELCKVFFRNLPTHWLNYLVNIDTDCIVFAILSIGIFLVSQF